MWVIELMDVMLLVPLEEREYIWSAILILPSVFAPQPVWLSLAAGLETVVGKLLHGLADRNGVGSS